MLRLIRMTLAVFVALLVALIVLVDSGYRSNLLHLVYTIPMGDKVGHFFLMGILALLVNLALCCERFVWGRWSAPKGTLWVLLAVTIEELSQYFVQSRTFSIQDWLADLLGIVLFTAVAHVLNEHVLLSPPSTTIGELR